MHELQVPGKVQSVRIEENQRAKATPPRPSSFNRVREKKERAHALHISLLQSTAETLIAAPLDSKSVEIKAAHVPSCWKD